MTGSSNQGIKTVLHPVSDLATAREVYAALFGVPPQTDETDGNVLGLLQAMSGRPLHIELSRAT